MSEFRVRWLCWCAACVCECSGAMTVNIESDAPDEITVTARKISEPLAQIPLVIHVVGSEALRRAGIDGLQSLADEVPGLYFESSYGGTASTPTLRGQTQPYQGGDNVGVFVDGVYQANNTALDTSMLDLERIEVVKGPQSSLYGRSTFSGAINYVTRRPSDIMTGEVVADSGSDGYRKFSSVLSGPLASSGVLLRAALSANEFDGTGINRADSRHNLGGYRKTAASVGMSYAASGWDVLANIRYADDHLGQPAVSALTALDYNCGSRNPVSGEWTYFCGSVPRTDRYDLSPGVPDSVSRTRQFSLRVKKIWDVWTVESLSSLYRSASDVYRDFDSSSQGGQFGVCSLASTCNTDSPQPVSRLLNVNQVTLDSNFVDEVTEELRARYHFARIDLMVGALVGSSRTGTFSAIGAAPNSALGADERLTVVVPGNSQLAGPLSILNRFLVADPNQRQITRFPTDVEHLHFTDVFAAVDFALLPRVSLHAEVRAGLFNSHSATTPRVSLDYRLASDSLLWLSYAEGQNNGGSNHDSTLIAAEQNYGPEYNRTYEMGFRGPLANGWIRLDAALFYIDWRDTQIAGPSNSPGDHGFIFRNLSGIETKGIELAADLRLRAGLHATLGFSYDDARFKRGSEDIGSAKFCGIQGSTPNSNFCTIGPSRAVTTGDAPLVPYVDGNLLLRSPQQQWAAALIYETPVAPNGLQGFGRVGLTHQGYVYFRPIDGGSSGERTLLNARFGLSRGPWSADIWGSNLTNDLYVREVDARGPAFFPISPRPHDLLYGDARRFGAGLTFRF